MFAVDVGALREPWMCRACADVLAKSVRLRKYFRRHPDVKITGGYPAYASLVDLANLAGAARGTFVARPPPSSAHYFQDADALELAVAHVACAAVWRELHEAPMPSTTALIWRRFGLCQVLYDMRERYGILAVRFPQWVADAS